jgi:hypothetical protein
MDDTLGADNDSGSDFDLDAEDTIEAQAAAQMGRPQVSIRIDESNLQTNYISGFRPSMGPEELVLDFGLNRTHATGNEDNPVEIVFQSSNRLIMSYYSAKRLAIAMSRVVRRYEEEFGEIELNAADRRIRKSE